MHRIDFKLHIMIVLNDLDKWALISPMLDHSKITKKPFWMIQRAKNEVLGNFYDFGTWDQLQIAYSDYTEQCWQVGCHNAHAGSFKNHKNVVLDDQKSQKLGFDHFWEFGQLDLLDIVYYERNICFQHFSALLDQERSYKNKKKCIYEWCKGSKWDFLAIFFS